MIEKLDQDWHALDVEAVFAKLSSKPSGLDESKVKTRLKEFGPNAFQLKTGETIPRIFLRQLHNPIVYVLLLSTLLALLLSKYADSLVVFSVVVLNTLIGFIQEYRANKTISALTSLIPDDTTVIRNGEQKIIPSAQLVPGDVVSLQAGDRIAADLRLFSVKNLQCDEAMLTGESLPVNKMVDLCPNDTLMSDRKCIAFNGTYVTAGIGFGVVVATGLKTEFGKIAALIQQVIPLETPISIVLKKIAQWITSSVLIASVCLFLIGYLRGNSLFDAAFAAIALAVAAIPEGLPAIITIASSIGMRRMAQKKAIIRQLPAVESIGSTSVICTDKTGTLTHNEMTVRKIWTLHGECTVSGAGYSVDGKLTFQNDRTGEVIAELLKAAILCSDATFGDSKNSLHPIGDPTEIALIVAGEKLGLTESNLRQEWPRKDVIPFESEKRIMATLNTHQAQDPYIFMKGAPEEIIAVCAFSENPTLIHAQIQSMAKEGLRVLAIAHKKYAQSALGLKENDINCGLTFLGLIGMIDPPRKEVAEALKSCREAGISVKMVTGDHPLTAEAIARDLGFSGNGLTVTGVEISQFDEQKWIEAAKQVQIFARVAPEHKLKLVEVLQKLGHVVAMTGDGVNDAPALKRADIGVAMGVKGTAVAKEASDIILADDNFANIEAAVREGRRVYDNLIKSLAFVLPTSLSQALIILLAVLFFPVQDGILLYPMSPVQILWVNLVVAVALSLPLAFESEEVDSMKRPPRKKQTPILSLFLLVKTVVISFVMALGTIALFLWEYQREMAKKIDQTLALSDAQTIAVTAIILFQIFYLFNCRSLRQSIRKTKFFANKYIFIGVGVVILAHCALIYLPLMNRLFKTSSLDLDAWLTALVVTLFLIPILALEKKVFRNKYNGSSS